MTPTHKTPPRTTPAPRSPETPRPDFTACDAWAASTALGAARVGIIPAWNAVTLLNPAAADIWDLLIETRDPDVVADRYAARRPERAVAARDDVAACLAVWDRQGLFRPPAPSPEQRRLAARAAARERSAGPPVAAAAPAFRRRLAVAGRTVTVTADDPGLGEVLADLLVDFPEADGLHDPRLHPAHRLDATGPAADGWCLYRDGQPVRLAETRVGARAHVVVELVRLAGGTDGWQATVHGAVLQGREGAVLLVGPSGAGKSTLAAGLIARGWAILAEDLAAFDAGWQVFPLPFALSIKTGAVPALVGAFPDLATARVHRLGAREVLYQSLRDTARAARSARPRLVLDVRFDPAHGAAPARVEPLSPTEAIGLFLNDESYIAFDRGATRGFLDFVEETPAYRLRYGTADAAAEAIDRLLAPPRATGR